MAEPYIGEIRLFSFNFPPEGWAICDGSTLQVQQYMALYSLIGNTFGGTPNVNFKLPDLRGRVPVHFGPATSASVAVAMGQSNGTETVAVNLSQIPAHTHAVCGENNLGNTVSPISQNTCLWSQASTATTPASAIAVNAYSNSAPNCLMDQALVSNTGGSGAHSNMQPYLVTNFCIAITGLYPPQP